MSKINPAMPGVGGQPTSVKKPPYEHQDYPSFRYNADGRSVKVTSEQDEALQCQGEGWSDVAPKPKPAPEPIKTLGTPTVEHLNPILEQLGTRLVQAEARIDALEQRLVLINREHQALLDHMADVPAPPDPPLAADPTPVPQPLPPGVKAKK